MPLAKRSLSAPPQDGFLPSGFEALTTLEGTNHDSEGGQRRSHFRNPVEVCRSIRLGPVPLGRVQRQRWWPADILDLSFGGLCLLLLAESGFDPKKRLRLDLSQQPGFGIAQLTVSLRWYVVQGPVVTLGVGFDEPFDPLPQLV